MSEQHLSGQHEGAATDQDKMSALFAQLVMQQTNMALLLMGKVAHPESGQSYKDVEAARLFIDQLEMLEAKTKGNLTKEELALLKQSLMNLRLAFVEAVESPEPSFKQASAKPEAASSSAAESKGPAETQASSATAGAEDEHRKKFSKKY
jgi:hypothetical protein